MAGGMLVFLRGTAYGSAYETGGLPRLYPWYSHVVNIYVYLWYSHVVNMYIYIYICVSVVQSCGEFY